MELTNITVFVIVIGLRLILPLFIPRYPLPAIIACLVIDAMDQTIFQTFTTLNLAGYQSYDKALDIYYLSIAYLSTFKNWTNYSAFQISQFLFYYRMFGNALFELTHIRTILFIFPNTFEYFFIFYSVLALRYKMTQFSARFFIYAAAFIWIFIKLPQEYWIHIAQLDTTDLIRAFFAQYGNNMPVLIAVFSAIAVFIFIVVYLLRWFIKKLPKPDHTLSFTYASAKKTGVVLESGYKAFLRKYRNQLIEKIVFVSLLTIIFAQMFPSFEGAPAEVFVGVTVIILINSLFGFFVIKSKHLNSDLVYNFLFMFVINSAIATIYLGLLNRGSSLGLTGLALILFFSYILTLITNLYDKFWPVYYTRFIKA